MLCIVYNVRMLYYYFFVENKNVSFRLSRTVWTRNMIDSNVSAKRFYVILFYFDIFCSFLISPANIYSFYSFERAFKRISPPLRNTDADPFVRVRIKNRFGSRDTLRLHRVVFTECFARTFAVYTRRYREYITQTMIIYANIFITRRIT